MMGGGFFLKNGEEKVFSPYETCVLCGKNTGILRNAPLWNRVDYVEGCGQLCAECAKKIRNIEGKKQKD